MRKLAWSVARMMADIASPGRRPHVIPGSPLAREMDDPGVGVLGWVLALVLTFVTDRALFGRRHRSFWLGFTAAWWLCAAMALSHLQETRRYLLEYGPLVVRARQDFQRQHAVARSAELRGLPWLRHQCPSGICCAPCSSNWASVCSWGDWSPQREASSRPPWRSSLGKQTTRRIDLNGSRCAGAMDYEWQLTTAIGPKR